MALVIAVVDTPATVKSMLDKLDGQGSESADIFFEVSSCERATDRISVCTIYMKSHHAAFVLDVNTLGSGAFFTSNTAGVSLKTIFADADIAKVVFDVRKVASALYESFQLSLAGIKDVQLMELASRAHGRQRLATLINCVNKESINLDVKDWAEASRLANVVASQAQYKSGEASIRGPIKLASSLYDLSAVSFLPRLFSAYEQKLSPPGQKFWRVQLKYTIIRLIEQAKTKAYETQNADGPWTEDYLEEATDSWNEDVMMCSYHGLSFDEENGYEGI
jgi:exonuclease 3'-5' domain-containing protein 1